MNRMIAFVAVAIAMLLAGCGTTGTSRMNGESLMPSGSEQTVDGLGIESFAAAEKFYDKISVGTTTVTDLAVLGLELDPKKTSKNVSILKQTDLSALFLPNLLAAGVTGDADFIDPAALACLKPSQKCTLYVYRKDGSSESGKGSLLLRVLNFKKESTVHSWNAEIQFVVSNGVVIWKQMGGTPTIERNKSERHPLGPFDGQGIGSLFKR